MGIRIDDLVAPEAKTELTNFLTTMESVKNRYVEICREMVAGISIKVTVIGDVDKLDNLVRVQSRELVQASSQMQGAATRLNGAIANTTNTISRQLAEQEKINKAQREAFTQQQRSLDVADTILGTHEQNVAALARTNRELKALKGAYKDQSISLEDYTRRELELKTAKQELQKILNNEAKMMQAAEGSYQSLSLELERLKMAQKQLNEEEKQGAEGQLLEKEIQNLDAHLKDMAADMGEFQRNVGNYAIAGSNLRTELKQLTMQMAQMLADGVDPTSEAFLEVAERAGTLKDAMADAKDTINDYANDTQGLTQGISVIETAVGGWQALEGAMSAFGIENEDAAKATQKLMGIMSLMNGIQKVSTELTTNGTGAYRAYHAILKLLGIEKAALTTATAAEATAQQAEATAATENAVAQAAGATATEAATVAAGAHTAAVGVETAALTGATAAATALKLALAALGIGAVIALIVTLYEGIKEFNKDAEQAAEISKGLNDAMKEGEKSTAATAAEMKYYVCVVNDFNGSAEEEKKLVDELNAKYGESIGYYQSIAQWKSALTSISEYYIDVLKWEAIAQANLQKYAEATAEGNLDAAAAYEKQFEFYKKMAAQQSKVVQNLVKLHGGGMKPTSGGSRSTRKSGSSRSTSTDNGAEDAEKEMQELINEANEMMDKFRETEIDRNIAMNAIITDVAIDTYNRQLDVVRSLYEEKEKLIIKDRDQAIAAEQEKYDKAIAEAKKYKKDTTDLADAREQAVAAIVSEYQQQIEDNEQALNDTIADMGADLLDKLQEAAATEQVIRDNALKQELVQLNERMAEELRLAGNNEQKIADIKDKYARLTAEKQEQYAIDTAKRQLQAYMDQLKNITGLGDVGAIFDDLMDVEGNAALLEGYGMAHAEALNMAKQLASAQVDIANAEADAEIAAIERVNDADKKSRDRRIENAEKWLGAAQDAIGNITDLVGTLFDGEISKIDEQMEAEQAHHDAEMANIEQLAERGAITQEEAELRKREAEARTAKEQEMLEKKKAALEYKQAVMQKVNSVAQIGIATALGIMQTYAKLGWPAGIPGAAIVAAMGAIQLATAIAQPIKAYKAGTDYHPGGLAIVGDGGKREVVETGGKYWLTPNVPTLVEMPQGSKVFPDYLDFIANEAPVDYGRLLAAIPLPDLSPVTTASTMPSVVVNNDYRALQRDVQELHRLVRAMTRQQHRDARDAKYDNWKRTKI